MDCCGILGFKLAEYLCNIGGMLAENWWTIDGLFIDY